MTDFNDIIDRSLRLALLRLLHEMPGYSANSAVLHTAAQSLGFHISRDKVATTLDWLREQGLLTLERLAGVTVAKLTARGADVATGLAVVTGVDRPSPKG